MALGAKLQMRQSQSLVMTPQLMQSIRLLQLTHFELERFIEEEVEKNPLLERHDARDDEPVEPRSAPDIADSAMGLDRMFEAADGDVEANSAQIMSDRLDTSMENVFPDDPGTSDRLGPDLAAQWKSAGSGNGASEGFAIEDMAAAALTLGDHVAEQIAFGFRDGTARLIARELADSLDEIGYMRAEIADVAARLGVDDGDVLAVLETCQTFDPPGLFARDLAECLALQLKAIDRFDPAMAAMIANLELLARRDFAQLRKLCRVDDDDLLDMLAEIRALDPRPGSAFAHGTADTIVPDVVVRAATDGSWAVELNPDTLPRVLVNQTYFATVSKKVANQSEKDFMADCLQSANWLARSLDQRAKTILKVATEIVRQQDAFLMHGIRHMRPLNLRMVADAIGMHESTVSRVTANKYMMTPRGVFELRYFFSVAIASAEGGDAHSSESVRDRIRELIDLEKPVDVLSDDAIVDILKSSGVDIARRTVAKYREGMSIPSSVQRRREKRALASAHG
ncbi:RNA polymerase factor sigma-54 [Mesorhizobium sp. CAU 1732]|uniref:RNA polymerase factor sigma-54 n=1 Tax=Mesorhizobium sp. CAU 1732 TaxID=3140358 RepID=UPI003261289D